MSSAATAGRRRGPVRLRAALARPPVVVFAIALASAVLAAWFALSITSFEPDELGYTRLAIGIAHSLTPFTRSYGGAARLNQLYPLLISPLWGLFGNVTAFRLTHALNALLMASAAIPAYLLAREVVRKRWACYLAAGVVAVMPWLTLSTAELTEVAAYPAAAWALLAMQRSLAAPSPRRDLIALLAIVVAAYGRLQLVVLAPAFVIAMLVHELGYAWTPRQHRSASLRQAASRLLRGHVVLSTAAILGIVVGVPLLVSGTLASAAGFYGNALRGASLGGATFNLARTYLTAISLGLGAIPAGLAIGFVFSALVAPVSRAVHAFASLAGVVVVALVLQVAEISVRFTGAVVQERYLFYIAPLLVVGMFAALLATRRPLRTVFAGCLILALLIATTHYEAARSAFWYQVSPGLTSYYDWVQPAFSASIGGAAFGAAGVVVAVIGALLALLLRWLPAERVLAGLAVAVIIFCGAETTHAFVDVVGGTAGGAGLGGGSLTNATWIDHRVPAGATVDQLTDEVGGLATASQLWNNNAFWNRTVSGTYALQYVPLRSYLPGARMNVDVRTGALSVAGADGAKGNAAAPQYLVVARRGFPVRPVGRIVARSPGGALELIRAAPPLRAAYLLSGVSPDGWLPLDRPAFLRLYTPGGSARRCATVSLVLSVSEAVPAAESLTLTTPGSPARRVVLSPAGRMTVTQPVCSQRAAVPALGLRVNAPASSPAAVVTPQLVHLGMTAR